MAATVSTRGAFKLEFTKQMLATGQTIEGVARAINLQGTTISRQFIRMVACGQRKASAAAVNRIADAMLLEPPDRIRLHRAAAIDAGYEIGVIA